MSHEADSFIDEVTEEVRRERLFATFRKYGWIAILAVILIVGGASWNEIRKSRAKTAAEALGDAILAAGRADTSAGRVSELSSIPVEGAAADVTGLIVAAEQLAADDQEAAVAVLRPVAEDPEAPAAYSDLAAFKMALIGAPAVDDALRAQLLERVARPGAPYRPLALEQQAMDLAAAGETDAAIEAAQTLLQEPGLTAGIRQRVTQLLVVLGEEAGETAG